MVERKDADRNVRKELIRVETLKNAEVRRRCRTGIASRYRAVKHVFQRGSVEEE